MRTYKLMYFNGRGRAEVARMLFKLAEQDFIDERIEREKWSEMKSSAPMGQLPMLEVDGVLLCQSNAINRFLAREFGLSGRTSLATAQVDMVIDSVEDLTAGMRAIFITQDPEEKAAKAKQFLAETLEPGLEKLEKLLQTNNGGDSFFVGDEITVADLAFVNIAGLALMVGGGDLSKYPKLQALKDRVESNPKIAAWIKARPETPF